ncbi:hypothetical protein NI389_05700 [Pseudoalteromonas xiamenensis]|uniref:hypothetical protein n=1 Tax=Pseudoalteromonas xiamenensis TaxID=882626 RepID=UPI0027E3D008|nr:hypothetical protein [Pseudoalteromonas xiamenensis]WMN60902.1 hypothetical protein NI389_05700 [Pseudoalteromonas xiamenensis]
MVATNKANSNRSIRRIATGLINPQCDLPKKLHDALNNIFIKGKIPYAKKVFTEKNTDSGGKNFYEVNRGSENAIYNALCLLCISETRNVKSIFTEFYKQKIQVKRTYIVNASDLCSSYDIHLAATSFFGVTPANISAIIDSLQKPEFDLFEHRLPSPFTEKGRQDIELEPIQLLFDVAIDWREVIDIISKVEELESAKKFELALKKLSEIKRLELKKLKFINQLEDRVTSQLNENKEALNYLKKILV